MTGSINTAIRQLKEQLRTSLQWAVCLLHCSNFFLRHIFKNLNGTTKSPSFFSKIIGNESEAAFLNGMLLILN